MMKKNILILLSLVIISCSSPLDKKIMDEDSAKYLDRICKQNEKYCDEIRSEYADFFWSLESGKINYIQKLYLIERYKKRPEDVKFRDFDAIKKIKQ
jgi:hypothetical protein